MKTGNLSNRKEKYRAIKQKTQIKKELFLNAFMAVENKHSASEQKESFVYFVKV